MTIRGKMFKRFFRVVLAAVLIGAFLISALLFGVIAAVQERERMTVTGEDEAGDVFVPIVITGTAKDGRIDLTVSGSGIKIEGIKGYIVATGFSATNGAGGDGIFDLPPSPPASVSTFSWMPQFDQSLYEYHLDHESPQYKYNQNCVNDSEGFRRYGDAYLVALGTYYGHTIGERYTLTFAQDDGSTLAIQAVRGDTKSDSDTDANHQYHLSDGSIVEFIMEARVGKNGKTIDEKFGTLAGISKGSMVAVLTGTISDDTIELTGEIGGYPMSASGTVTDGVVNAAGYYGSGATGTGAYPGEPLAGGDFGTLMAVAMAQLGKPYVFGASGPDSFDCSGYVIYCYKNALGKVLPRTAAAQQKTYKTVSAKERQPGDLVFFQGTYKTGVSHVGIYIGNDQMIHAGGSEVHYSSLSDSYYVTHFHSYGRVE
jgi:cell wall-associated NlpC family hydrolase